MLDEVVIALTDVNVSIKEGFPVSRIKTFGDVIYLGEINGSNNYLHIDNNCTLNCYKKTD